MNKIAPTIVAAALIGALGAGVGAAVAAVVVARPAHAGALDASVTELAHAIVAASTANMGDIINARGRPVDATEEEVFGQLVSTTTLSLSGDSTTPGTTGMTEATFDDQFVQNFRVFNRNAANGLCLRTVTRSSSAQKCSAACTAFGATLACSAAGAAAAGDGTWIAPGSPPFPYPVVGTDCLCGKAQAANTEVQTTRVLRAPNL